MMTSKCPLLYKMTHKHIHKSHIKLIQYEALYIKYIMQNIISHAKYNISCKI